MLATTPPPSDQRAGSKPIAFILDVNGRFSEPVFLSIRPEDLTRNEPTRATVHQTLGRDLSGWVDNFGEGLPSVTLAGHTGWRFSPGNDKDGLHAFESLNKLVQHDFNKEKQDAIDRGGNPASVKLLFVDVLDDFAWSVVPTQFILRRSKSRPLLFQYNITLQAISTDVSRAEIRWPTTGSPQNGLFSLNLALDKMLAAELLIPAWVDQALLGESGYSTSLAAQISAFTSFAAHIFSTASELITAAGGMLNGPSSYLIGLARKVASAGANIFRMLNGLFDLPAFLKANLITMAASFNEVLCIFSNSLSQREVYEQYTSLRGASNCSSTTGGSPISPLTGINVFQQMAPAPELITMSTAAISSVAVLMNMDPVLSPLPMLEISRHLGNIVQGVL